MAYGRESSNIAMSEMGVTGEGLATSSLAEGIGDRERATQTETERKIGGCDRELVWFTTCCSTSYYNKQNTITYLPNLRHIFHTGKEKSNKQNPEQNTGSIPKYKYVKNKTNINK